VLLLSPGVARASLDYPDLVESEWDLDSTPGCQLCHRDAVGRAGTVTQRFGRYLMLQFGVVGKNPGSLRRGLSDAKAAELNSDGDGANDYDELRQGTNPNVDDVERPPPMNNDGGSGGHAGGEGGASPGATSGGEGTGLPPLPTLPPLPRLPEHGCNIDSAHRRTSSVSVFALALLSAAFGQRRRAPFRRASRDR
jgi:hypothetical protein